MAYRLEDILSIIGFFTLAIILMYVVMWVISKIAHLVGKYRENKKYEYMLAHRFDGPPLAKCYCIDCEYHYGEPTESGGGIYCGLFNGDIAIADNSFCYRATPKKKGR